MAGKVDFRGIILGNSYNRRQLSELWGYKGHQAFSRGVFTPAKSKLIVLFVTKNKQLSATQYVDYINDDFLYWEGEKSGANNSIIINSDRDGTAIHLFYRDVHHQEFKYKGIVKFLQVVEKSVFPYNFVFEIVEGQQIVQFPKVLLDPLSHQLDETDKLSLILSRRGQGKFRIALFALWKTCAVTNVNLPEILKASHIRPWRDSSNSQRLDPYNGVLLNANLDTLFDCGLISFADSGEILISKKITSHCSQLNILQSMRLKMVFDENIKYLEYHRSNIFKGL